MKLYVLSMILLIFMISFGETYDSGIQSFLKSFARISESTSSFFILDSAVRLIFRKFAGFRQDPLYSMKSYRGSYNPVYFITKLSQGENLSRNFSLPRISKPLSTLSFLAISSFSFGFVHTILLSIHPFQYT